MQSSGQLTADQTDDRFEDPIAKLYGCGHLSLGGLLKSKLCKT